MHDGGKTPCRVIQLEAVARQGGQQQVNAGTCGLDGLGVS